MRRIKVIVPLIALIACLSVIGTVYVITTIRPEEEKVTVELPRVEVNGTKLVE